MTTEEFVSVEERTKRGAVQTLTRQESRLSVLPWRNSEGRHREPREDLCREL